MHNPWKSYEEWKTCHPNSSRFDYLHHVYRYCNDDDIDVIIDVFNDDDNTTRLTQYELDCLDLFNIWANDDYLDRTSFWYTWVHQYQYGMNR